MEDLRNIFNSYKEEMVPAKGLTINIDGIECYGLYGKIKRISFQDRIIYKGIGDAIFVDKNHDLSYYINGSDHLNSSDFNNLSNTFGYEWGEYGISTDNIADGIGSGLSNTNILIAKNLQPNTDGWHVVWDKIKEFRVDHSNNWFLPSKDELNLIYEVRNHLSNLSTSTYPYYWSSSGYSFIYTWFQHFDKGIQDVNYKGSHNNRSRLCRQY